MEFWLLNSIWPCLFLNMFTRGGVEDTKARDQEHKKNPRPRTALPRTDPLEIKHTDASVLQKKKKKVFKNFFQAISKRGKQKRSSQIFRGVSSVFLHNFKHEQIPTIVGTDANAHHAIWEFSDINPQGEGLLAYRYCVS